MSDLIVQLAELNENSRQLIQRYDGAFSSLENLSEEKKQQIINLVVEKIESIENLSEEKREEIIALANVKLGEMEDLINEINPDEVKAEVESFINNKVAEMQDSVNEAEENLNGKIQQINEIAEQKVEEIRQASGIDMDEVREEVSVAVERATKIDIEQVILSGHNSFLVLAGGRVYSTSGICRKYSNSTTGRGSNCGNPFYGLDNLKLVPIPEDAKVVKIGGGYHTFAYALLENGHLYTWGRNKIGQCGLGHTGTVAIPTLSATNVVDVFDHPSNGGSYIEYNRLFIKKTDGYIYGTGYNGYGQLGIGSTSNKTVWTKIESLGTDVKKVFNMGTDYGCLVVQKEDNSIWVCGYNGHGQLGTGDTNNKTTPVDVTNNWGGGSDWEIVKVFGMFGYYDGNWRNYNTLGMLLKNVETGETKLAISGRGDWGQIGNGSTGQRNIPYIHNFNNIKDVSGIGGVLSVRCLLENGELYTWGYNGYGQLGTGDTNNRTSPQLVQTNVKELLCDGVNSNLYGYVVSSFIKKEDGKVYACGYNGGGQLGIGHTSNSYSFVKVKLPEDKEVKFMGNYTTEHYRQIYVAVTKNNEMFVWGDNSQFGVTSNIGINCSNNNNYQGCGSIYIAHCVVPVQVNFKGV